MTIGANDYTYRDKPADGAPDGDGYWYRECTSFVRDRVARDLGPHLDFLGDAASWARRGQLAGFPVDNVPAPHSVAILGPHVAGAGASGHVAFVLEVHGNVVRVEDYNWIGTHAYAQHDLAVGGVLFLHLPQPEADTMSSPEFDKVQGQLRDHARGTMRITYLAILHREPSVADLDHWTNEAVANGVDSALANLADNSPEPKADEQQDYARDHQPVADTPPEPVTTTPDQPPPPPGAPTP